AGKLKLLYHPETTRQAYKRLGLTVATLSLPFIVAGKLLLSRLRTLPEGTTLLVLTYSTILALTALIAFGRYLHYRRFGYEDENPLPPGGLSWKYPLAAPGLAFPKYITVSRASLVGGCTGLCTGLAGLNTCALLEPLLMYLTGLPRLQARATASFALYLIGGFASLIYLPDLFTFTGAGLTFVSLGTGYLAGYFQAARIRQEKFPNPKESIFLAWWALSSALVLTGNCTTGLSPVHTLVLMFGTTVITMLGFTLTTLFQER
ncbi:TSUP family transporter, partial [Desulfofundulus sp.]|uniref:TSUP family transporter n=1 Tax=Desulfofundulus sp. TaxID=2282750 RepID=UPI003C7507E0